MMSVFSKVITVVGILAFSANTLGAEVFLPGMQPKEAGIEFCLRCHAPRAWLERRSTPTDGSVLNTEDMYGISCTVCHCYENRESC